MSVGITDLRASSGALTRHNGCHGEPYGPPWHPPFTAAPRPTWHASGTPDADWQGMYQRSVPSEICRASSSTTCGTIGRAPSSSSARTRACRTVAYGCPACVARVRSTPRSIFFRNADTAGTALSYSLGSVATSRVHRTGKPPSTKEPQFGRSRMRSGLSWQDADLCVPGSLSAVPRGSPLLAAPSDTSGARPHS